MCKQCKQSRGESTQCDNCEEPELMPENREAVEVYWHCATQWRVSFGGATGLDYNAVNTVMKWLGVKRKKRCFKKIRVLESEQLSILHARQN